MKQISFADAKPRKYVAEHVFDVDAAPDPLQSPRREAQVFGDELQLLGGRVERSLQRPKRIGESRSVPLQRDQRRRRPGHPLFGEIGDGVKQLLDAGAGESGNSDRGALRRVVRPVGAVAGRPWSEPR